MLPRRRFVFWSREWTRAQTVRPSSEFVCRLLPCFVAFSAHGVVSGARHFRLQVC